MAFLKSLAHPKRELTHFFNHPLDGILIPLTEFYNLFIRNTKIRDLSSLKELNEIKKKSVKRTDISDHLQTLFHESMSINPKLIVEIGVRGGESTFVFERVAKLCESELVSVDIDDCSEISSLKTWSFVQMDDTKFAGEFKSWCKKKRINPEIDILFIDGNHTYHHVVKEINVWFPYLSKKSKVFFHDSNLTRIYYRKDGSVGVAYNNKGEVMRAIETYFKRRLTEKIDFVDIKDGWMIKHNANCCGLTTLEKLD